MNFKDEYQDTGQAKMLSIMLFDSFISQAGWFLQSDRESLIFVELWKYVWLIDILTFLI